jgi:exonuclease VII small subunit
MTNAIPEETKSTTTYAVAFSRIESNAAKLQNGEVDVDEIFEILSQYAEDSKVCKDIIDKLEAKFQEVFKSLPQ